jgi:hypothetical protein
MIEGFMDWTSSAAGDPGIRLLQEAGAGEVVVTALGPGELPALLLKNPNQLPGAN